MSKGVVLGTTAFTTVILFVVILWTRYFSFLLFIPVTFGLGVYYSLLIDADNEYLMKLGEWNEKIMVYLKTKLPFL